MSFRSLVLITFILASFVVLKGAYTRLVDAGLGCPDWPGCYGFVAPPKTPEAQAIANQRFPARPVEVEKAWPEMIHRYMASTLGLLIIAIAVIAYRQREKNYPYKLAIALVPLVIFQGWLGKLTVTMGLFPPTVVGHLLGGFFTLALLGLMVVRLYKPSFLEATKKSTESVHTLALVAFTAVIFQVALGGWTSANYAALVCPDLPVCQPGWTEMLDFENAFSVGEANDQNHYEFGVLPAKARLTIHVLHRFGALLVTILVGFLIYRLIKAHHKNLALALAAVLTTQILLGVSIILFELPLFAGVAHNGVAALLLITLFFVVMLPRREQQMNTERGAY